MGELVEGVVLREFNPYHDERGRFASAPGSGVPRLSAHQIARHVADAVSRGDGISINPWGYQPQTGYMVGGALPPHVVSLPALPPKRLGRFVAREASAFVRRHRREIVGRQLYVGAWIEDGKLYLDGSNRTTKRYQGVLLGGERSEIAIWDVARGREIRITPEEVAKARAISQKVRSKRGS